jgi:2-polyprenyl-3-methyl-5-hydroxy-6-metoxy-1,4-benzoquinol methylase
MREQISRYYENYDEDGRLFRDNAHKVEYLTTIRYFDRMFAPGSTIFDACTGTGNYALYLADKGHIVTAGDLVEHNLNILRAKPAARKLAQISACDVLDLSQYSENSFDVVLCMGALYHLRENEARRKAISECARVCKPDGLLVLAYITKVGAVLANINADASNMAGLIKVIDGTDDREPFFCASPREIEEMASSAGLNKLRHIGVDGCVETIGHKLNSATDENFAEYMEYHYMTCEDESILGASIHGLYIGKKL